MRTLIKSAAALLILLLCTWFLKTQLQGITWTSCLDAQQRFLSLGIWAPFLIFLGFVLSSIAIVPGTILAMFTGLTFGLFWGTLLALVGVTSGASLAFFLTRTIARQPIEKLLKDRPWFHRLQSRLRNNGFEFILFVRFVPLFPFTGLNFACGLLPIRARDFILGSLIGMLPGTFVYVYLGKTGCQLIERMAAPNFRFMDLPEDLRLHMILGVALLGFLSLVPLLWRQWKKRSSRSDG